jgi:hypothetical protein
LKTLNIVVLSSQEAKLKGIVNASMQFLILNDRVYDISILYDKDRSKKEKLVSLIIEFCNALFVKEHHQLDQQVKKCTISKADFVIGRESLEWRAIGLGYEIAKELDLLKLYFQEDTVNNFDSYFSIQKKNHHTKNYERFWERYNGSSVAQN